MDPVHNKACWNETLLNYSVGESYMFVWVLFFLKVSAVGYLQKPHIPEITGQNRFSGRAFHSCQWSEDLDLEGKRVALIGSAASAVQIAPKIVDKVTPLMFQYLSFVTFFSFLDTFKSMLSYADYWYKLVINGYGTIYKHAPSGVRTWDLLHTTQHLTAVTSYVRPLSHHGWFPMTTYLRYFFD